MDTQKTTWTDVDIDRNAPMVSAYTTVDVVEIFDLQNFTSLMKYIVGVCYDMT